MRVPGTGTFAPIVHRCSHIPHSMKQVREKMT
jgi:hypothetical protein